MTRPQTAYAAGLTLLLVAGCGPAGVAGTLEMGGDRSQSCVATPSGQPMLVGEVLEVDGAAVTVSGVELVAASGVRVVDSYILRVAGDAIGSSEFPPEDTSSWQQRTPAIGAQLNPGDPLQRAGPGGTERCRVGRDRNCDPGHLYLQWPKT